MESEEFADKVTAAVRKEISKWSYDHNPMAWDGFPTAMLEVYKDLLCDAMKGVNEFPPITIAERNDGEAMFEAQICFYEDGDDYFVKRYSLADSVLIYAELNHEGWSVSKAIRALKISIIKMEREALKRGWKIEP